METDNELIAVFMGMKVYNYGSDPCYIEGPMFPNSPPTLAEFDTSWDWLMPVVEKIERLGIMTHKYELYPEGSVWISFWIETDRREECKISVSNTLSNKITAYHQAVVEFIKWYNEYNPKQ